MNSGQPLGESRPLGQNSDSTYRWKRRSGTDLGHYGHPVMFDTQVVSYAMKGIGDFDISNGAISSVVAQEFLQAQGDDLRRLRYPLDLVERVHAGARFLTEYARLYRARRRHSPRGESYIINIGSSYPPVVERGHRGISILINSRQSRWFRALISCLDRVEQRKLSTRFDFLASSNIQCWPLDRFDVEVTVELMEEFAKRWTMKADFRNSLNDMFILATALRRGGQLITKDKVLTEFSQKYLGAKTANYSHGFAKIQLASIAENPTHASESKAYVNRAWRFKPVSESSVGVTRIGRRWTSY